MTRRFTDEYQWCFDCTDITPMGFDCDHMPICARCHSDDIGDEWPCCVCGDEIPATADESDYFVKAKQEVYCSKCNANQLEFEAQREAYEQAQYAASEDASAWRKRGL